MQLPAALGDVLSGASAILYDRDGSSGGGSSGGGGSGGGSLDAGPAGLHHLPAFLEASLQSRVHPLRPLLHSLRWRKSPAELALMRRSAQLAAGAMAECMRLSHGAGGTHEHSLAAAFEYR